ncbi:diiron oxygenase, partial [Streptomyces sp. SID10244]|nr:diiron oxygenase [Streptomyces sp. SID10244]
MTAAMERTQSDGGTPDQARPDNVVSMRDQGTNEVSERLLASAARLSRN